MSAMHVLDGRKPTIHRMGGVSGRERSGEREERRRTMRRFIGLSATAILVLAACSSSASTPAPTPTVEPPTTPGPTASATAPSASASTAQAKVTFDGDVCKYFGPTVVPSNTKMTIDFQVPDSSLTDIAMVMGPVWDGTTAEDVKKIDTDWPPSKGQPPFVLSIAGYHEGSKVGPGSITIDLDAMTHSHAYVITCLDYKLDKARAAGLIQVLPA